MKKEPEVVFTREEVIGVIETWTSLYAEPENDDERVVQRTCRRLKNTFEHMAEQKMVKIEFNWLER